jgi:hypothetical protein
MNFPDFQDFEIFFELNDYFLLTTTTGRSVKVKNSENFFLWKLANLRKPERKS